MDENEGTDEHDGDTNSHQNEQREHLQDGRIGAHDVHNLTGGSSALGGGSEFQSFAVNSLDGHGFHLNTNTNHLHLGDGGEIGDDNGDHQKEDGVGPALTVCQVGVADIEFLKIGDEFLKNQCRAKAEEEGDNEEEEGPNPGQWREREEEIPVPYACSFTDGS